MLILSRKVGESVMIGDDVVVTVLEIRHGQARIGIAAPRDVEVHREEVLARIVEQREGKVPKVRMVKSPACKPHHRSRLTLERTEQHL